MWLIFQHVSPPVTRGKEIWVKVNEQWEERWIEQEHEEGIVYEKERESQLEDRRPTNLWPIINVSSIASFSS